MVSKRKEGEVVAIVGNVIEVGRDIGMSSDDYNKYILLFCLVCGKERWVGLRKSKTKSYNNRCHSCAAKAMFGRENNPMWKGGICYKGGYIHIKTSTDSPFSAMINARGYIPEHRLVMAKHLGRCLHRWEIVHHKNGIKDDNRLENLQLVSDGRHKAITTLEQRVKFLENRVTLLEAENVLLKGGSINAKRFANYGGTRRRRPEIDEGGYYGGHFTPDTIQGTIGEEGF